MEPNSGLLEAGADLRQARVVCAVGCLAAISFVLTNVRVAMPGAPYLLYDPADVPALVAAFTMGPAAGFMVVLLRNLLHGLLVAPELVGHLMNVLASGSFVWVSGLLYIRFHTRTGAIFSLGAGTCAQSMVMVAANAAVLPLYLGLTSKALASTLAFTILPFNLIKGAANSVLVYLLYKRVSGYLPR